MPKTSTKLNDFVDVKETCRILGGSKPWHPSTLWRALKDPKRNLPRPVHTSPGQIRFIRKELLDAKAAMIAARDDPVAQAEIARRNQRINDARVKARAKRHHDHEHQGEEST
jgi:predicted DNA-binding transcriptional regulator AlpA